MPFIYSGNRDKFVEKLAKSGIGTNVSYRYPIHLMPAYKYLNYNKNDFPNAEYLCNHNISFLFFDGIPESIVLKVCMVIKKLISKGQIK